MESRIDKIKQQLQSQGYKLTPQREATVRVLLENEEDHLSAEDVFMLVKDIAPEIGLATVYRTLELLSELHVVEKMNFGDGVARYDLRADNNKHHHHHLICVQCGTMSEILEDWLGPLEERLEREYGFTVLDHRLDFQGICVNCKAKNDALKVEN
ncbi:MULTISPECIES: Fur family transcriptional regulator [Paenibacillus]|uniref:Transcriptional repressor n=1 Tax=Paenibacillus lignilyticus TaxID=1172615 RepID=A0ABS5CEI4_9BACL|nr:MULTISPECIES: Fur family transcriptional regulator [Paenibacillus]MBP3964396.1 transcriptional repressor [Paenibacillus lignilyticus]SDW32495.1 Fur family transcriptional regulator, ferric uptake regulator [Paenibacillus sp. CF384]SFS82692.1 Fur family transcriptional regulator, ferric uptake regulator [Paenibacillus sp. BC26]